MELEPVMISLNQLNRTIMPMRMPVSTEQRVLSLFLKWFSILYSSSSMVLSGHTYSRLDDPRMS